MATYDVSMAITRPPCFAHDEPLCDLLRKACRDVMVRPSDVRPSRLIVNADPTGIHMLEWVLRETIEEVGGNVESIAIARVIPNRAEAAPDRGLHTVRQPQIETSLVAPALDKQER